MLLQILLSCFGLLPINAHAWWSINPRMHHKQIVLWVLHMCISVTFNFRMKGCYSRFYYHVFDYCQWLRIRGSLSIKECIKKEIELWVLHMRISLTFNFRQLAIANPNSIHSLYIQLSISYHWFSYLYKFENLIKTSLTTNASGN